MKGIPFVEEIIIWGYRNKLMLISKYGNGSKELVREFESRLGIELDEEYRSFLVKYNGGDTPNTHVGIRGFSVRQISDSFKLFLAKCKSGEINPHARATPEERETALIAKGRAHVITDGLREIWKKEYEKYKDMVQEKVIL